MHKIFRLAMPLVVMVLLLGICAPVLAAPPQGTVDCVVEPVIGGPNNPQTHATPANVTIPANNPAIRWNPTDIMPGNVFVPAWGG